MNCASRRQATLIAVLLVTLLLMAGLYLTDFGSSPLREPGMFQDSTGQPLADCAPAVGVGQWVGDVWIPSNGRLYTVSEIRHALKGRRILILGDSLARRLTATLAILANDTKSNELHANSEIDDKSRLIRGWHDKYRWVTPDRGQLVFQWAPHVRDISNYAQAHNLTEYNDVIISNGIHDAQKHTKPTQYREGVNQALDAFRRFPSVNFVWRTAPLMDDPKDPGFTNQSNARLRQLNCIVKGATAAHVAVVDTAAALAKKSVGAERLRGDSPEHFGNIARMVIIQMLLPTLQHTAHSPLNLTTQF